VHAAKICHWFGVRRFSSDVGAWLHLIYVIVITMFVGILLFYQHSLCVRY